jgi:hypothetical protein
LRALPAFLARAALGGGRGFGALAVFTDGFLGPVGDRIIVAPFDRADDLDLALGLEHVQIARHGLGVAGAGAGLDELLGRLVAGAQGLADFGAECHGQPFKKNG